MDRKSLVINDVRPIVSEYSIFYHLNEKKHRHGFVIEGESEPVCLEAGCYVVVCVRRNLGIQVVEKLISMGANKITINTPEPKSEFLQTQLHKWRLKGIQLKICSENVISTAACLTLLSRASELGDVRGVFVTSPTLDVPGNHFGESQLGVARLDAVSKRICQHLKYFVIFSPMMTEHDSEGFCFENIFRQRDLDNLPILEVKCLDNDSKRVNDESTLIEVLSQSLTTVLKDLHALLPHNLCVVTYSEPNHTKEDFINVDGVGIEDKSIDEEDVCVPNKLCRRGLYYTQISIKHMIEQRENTNSEDSVIRNIEVLEPEVPDFELNENGETVKLCQKMALGDMRVEDIIHRKIDTDENLIS